MSVIITPSEQLEFHSPFTRICKQSLYVRNPGTEPIIFKIKTTAPKQYCVRPNAGRIEANSEIEVQIILQPFKEELPANYKCKDKFLVQTAPITEAVEQNHQDIASMWSYVEAEGKASLHQQKIKCVFITEQHQPSTTDDIYAPITKEVSSIPEPVTNADNITSSAIPTNSSDNDASVPSTTMATAAAPIPVPAPEIAATTATATATATAPAPAPAPVPAPTSPATASPATASPATASPAALTTPSSPISDDNNELKKALEKIAKLEKELAELKNQEEGLRARNQSTTRKLAPTVQPLDAVHQHLAALEKPRPTEGYPPQVVLGVALFVFIFTYLFF